jgi:hypothetical protein
MEGEKWKKWEEVEAKKMEEVEAKKMEEVEEKKLGEVEAKKLGEVAGKTSLSEEILKSSVKSVCISPDYSFPLV